MPFQKVTFRPGINVQKTPLLNDGGWSSANLIRFRDGLAEVMGGWQPFMPGQQVNGVCRGMHGWTTLAGINVMAAGTNLDLYVIEGGAVYEITPIAQTTTPTNPFTTTLNSNVITVSDSSLTTALAVGDYVVISSATTFNGIPAAALNLEQQITAVISTTSYQFQVTSTATGAGAGGGTPTLEYLLPIGSADAATAAGWGTSTWGASTWGTARTGISTYNLPRIWFLDNWGEYLIANPVGGALYVWEPGSGTSVRASLVSSAAPANSNAMLISNSAQQIVTLGASIPGGGSQDPMLVSWCNSSDYTTWVAATSNNAGSYRLTNGSRIVSGAVTAQQILIWTDTALFSMQFQANVYVYGFQQLGTACGLVSPKAAAVVGNAAFWMSGLNFMSYTGTVQPIPCSVRDLVYKNLNMAQIGKVVASTNTQFNEVRWDYPSLNSTENDSYVIYNYADNNWTVGNNSNSIVVARTAWLDYSVFGNPTAFDAYGNCWSHEVGYTANGSALPFFLESGDIDIAEGEIMAFVDLMIPDQIMTGGPITMWVYGRAYPADAVVAAPSEPFEVYSTTEFIPFRLRARQISIRIDNTYNAVGVFWRMGATRFRIAQDGRT